MKIVVDTNILFSALVNTNSHIGDMLFNTPPEVEFYSCKLLKEELNRHYNKLTTISRLTTAQLKTAEDLLFKRITFISENTIIKDHWLTAVRLTSEIDADDIAFVALTLHLEAKLWTGDKRLIKGLALQGFNRVVTTQEMIALRDK